MKLRNLIPLTLLSCILLLTACNREDAAVKKDAKAIAEVMCKSLEAMKSLKSVNPEDTALITQLQEKYRGVEQEMTGLYDGFRKKYEAKMSDKEFTKKFRRYLNEAMLDCKSLSKEDRANFERQSE